ncbi:MAG: glycosidase [Porphyrobacter sp.]|nr:glycosidase [Porphyrobacter sp.]
MVAYVVEQLDEVAINGDSPIAGMDLLSPFVWRENGCYRMLLRAVSNPLRTDEPTGVIAAARSDDGLHFQVDPKLAIVPDADPKALDAGGCEDPTVIVAPEGGYTVFYTGVDAGRRQGSLMVASGKTLDRLVKREVAIKAAEGEGNVKEATLVQTRRGGWRLFFEYASENASRVGLARESKPGGPWQQLPVPFTIREKLWDNWHLSTGPVVQLPGLDPVMFYNGATIDARWRIGWISFDEDFTRVTGRCIEPVLVPPPAKLRTEDDIAFAASALIEDGLITLYFSIEDRMLRRARIRAYR